MTSPEGRAGITPGPLQDAVSIDGDNGNIPGLSGLDQPYAEQLLKDLYIKDNPKINDPIDDVFAGMRSGIAYSLALIESLVNAIIGAPSGNMFLNIGHANSVVSLFIGGITGTVTEHTEAIADLNEITSAMNTTAAYVGDLQDMVTIPRGLLNAPGPILTTGITKNVDILAGFAIEAALGVKWTLPVFTPQVYLFSATGNIYYTPIVVDRKGTIDKLRWIVGTDETIFAIDYYEVALCAYNPANGRIEKVWGSGNIKDGIANTSAKSEVALPMGLNQSVTPGQILFIAHQQVASGLFQAARKFAAVPQGDVGRPIELAPLDAWCYIAPNFTTGIPSSIPFTGLTKENRFCPWGAVRVNAPVVAP